MPWGKDWPGRRNSKGHGAEGEIRLVCSWPSGSPVMPVKPVKPSSLGVARSTQARCLALPSLFLFQPVRELVHAPVPDEGPEAPRSGLTLLSCSHPKLLKVGWNLRVLRERQRVEGQSFREDTIHSEGQHPADII